MTQVMTMMQTTINKDKSGYILMGSKKHVEEAGIRIKGQPMIRGDFIMN